MLVPREIVSPARSRVENLETGLKPDETPYAEGWLLQTELVGSADVSALTRFSKLCVTQSYSLRTGSGPGILYPHSRDRQDLGRGALTPLGGDENRRRKSWTPVDGVAAFPAGFAEAGME